MLAKKYRCILCGYVYDPEVGDASGSVPAGTSFEDLSGDWVCPLCGAPRISSNPQTDITILGMSKIFWSDFRAFGSVVLDLEHGTVQNPSSLFTSFSLIAGAILDLIV